MHGAGSTPITLDGFYVPEIIRDDFEDVMEEVELRRGEQVVIIRRPRVTEQLLSNLADALRDARRYLAELPVAQVIATLDETSRRWLQPDFPPLRKTLEVLPAVTGLSRPMVAESIRLEHESSLGVDMRAAVRSRRPRETFPVWGSPA